MNWLEITLSAAPGKIGELAAALTDGGFADLVLEDQQELESFLDQNREYWDYIDEALASHLQGLSQVKLYLEEEDRESLTRLGALVEKLQTTLGEIRQEISLLPQTDWEESWKDHYPPQEVGDRLVVLPYWLADSYTGSRLSVILDPGLTFGTGAHPSTQMVMEEMETRIRKGCRCLDLGSGSGILSITALRLGAGSAVGVDIDPKAETIARENAAYNGSCAEHFTALTGNVTGDKKLMERLCEQTYDLVLVNIVADVIIALAPVLPNFLDAHSILICSGILDTRLADVKAALLQAGLTLTHIREKEDWRCICAKRSSL